MHASDSQLIFVMCFNLRALYSLVWRGQLVVEGLCAFFVQHDIRARVKQCERQPAQIWLAAFFRCSQFLSCSVIKKKKLIKELFIGQKKQEKLHTYTLLCILLQKHVKCVHSKCEKSRKDAISLVLFMRMFNYS